MNNPLLVLYGLAIIGAIAWHRVIVFSIEGTLEPYDRVWSGIAWHPSQVPRGEEE